MNSKHITDTDSRLFEGLSSVVTQVYEQQGVEQKIKDTVEESMITTGVMTKFYPYLNKCEVLLDKYDKKVICKNALMFNGDLLLFYTPNGDRSYCERLKEPCIIPRGNLGVFVVNVHDDTDEYYMLSYFLKDDLVYSNPSAPGNFKILAMGAVNEYSIKFGIDGLKIVSNGDIEATSLSDLEDEGVVREFYTKSEIDDLIGDAISYINQ